MHSSKKKPLRRQYRVIDPAMADFLYEDIENTPDLLEDLQIWFSSIFAAASQKIIDLSDKTQPEPEPLGEFDNEFMQNARSRRLATARRKQSPS